ncbi:MAG: phosphoribosyltransferase [Ruminococcus flavefaciens]|nr:phosphoribosyltransferase [Ruminococcus flavefaciens]
MYEIERTERINRLIAITKSNSGISGPDLAKAHMELGVLLGRKMVQFDPSDTTVVAILRGGIFFAEGIYFQLGCKFQIYDPKREEFVKPKTKNVILVDSVINTGKTIQNIYEEDMFIACCVINENAISYFDEKLFTIRISKNSFVGNNVHRQSGKIGPDTTMRLFNLL